MKALYKFKVLKVGKGELYKGKTLYLCNHRSWADFMVDQYVTGGRSLFMSRWAVACVFPLFMVPMWLVRSCLVFKRGGIADKIKFNDWIDTEWEKSPQTGLGVYPEGHRSTDGKSLPLKRGMLRYAFDRRIPVQIVIGGNKEAVLAEKQLSVGFYQTVTVGYSDVIHSSKFHDFEAFMKNVQDTWDKEWREVFSTPWEGLEELPEPEPYAPLPKRSRYLMLLICPLEILLIIFFLTSVTKLIWIATMSLGYLQVPFLVLVSVYVRLSFALASRPSKHVFHLKVDENKIE